MKIFMLFCCLMLGVLSQAGLASERCTKQDLHQVENVSLVFQDWGGLYKSHARFKQCDNGGDVSEGYSEAVVRLLADHWSDLDQLAAYSKKSKSFRAFVLRHIDATTSDRDLKLIAQSADVECPSNVVNLCVEIGAKAKAAIQESER